MPDLDFNKRLANQQQHINAIHEVLNRVNASLRWQSAAIIVLSVAVIIMNVGRYFYG